MAGIFYKNYEASADANYTCSQLSVRLLPIGKTGRTMFGVKLSKNLRIKEGMNTNGAHKTGKTVTL
jgi:hypothetical protein